MNHPTHELPEVEVDERNVWPVLQGLLHVILTLRSFGVVTGVPPPELDVPLVVTADALPPLTLAHYQRCDAACAAVDRACGAFMRTLVAIGPGLYRGVAHVRFQGVRRHPLPLFSAAPVTWEEWRVRLRVQRTGHGPGGGGASAAAVQLLTSRRTLQELETGVRAAILHATSAAMRAVAHVPPLESAGSLPAMYFPFTIECGDARDDRSLFSLRALFAHGPPGLA